MLTGHVAISTARVAGLSSTTAAIPATERTTIRTASLGAIAGNVADLAALSSSVKIYSPYVLVVSEKFCQAYLVALSGLGTASTASTAKRTFARNVTRLATLVAGLVLLHGLRAVSAYHSQYLRVVGRRQAVHHLLI